MSSRLPLRFVVPLLGVLTGLVGNASAQTAAGAARRFTALQDTLARVRDSIRDLQPEMDTLRLGAFRVVVRPQLAERIQPAIPRALERLQRRYGGIAFVPTGAIHVGEDRDGDGRVGLGARIYPTEVRWNAGAYYAGGSAPVDSIALMLARAAEDGLSPAAGVAFRDWVGGSPLNWEWNGAGLEQAYVEMVTDPTHATQGCLHGDLRSCRRAFGLVPTSNPARDWFDAEDRRARIRQMAGQWVLSSKRGQVEACLDRRDFGVCDILFSSLSPDVIQPPFSVTARASLANLALRQGGDAAFERLAMHPTGGLGDRLAFAAGVPLDSLLVLWRGEVLRARPATVAVSGASTAAALGWVALLGLMALRSSRWR